MSNQISEKERLYSIIKKPLRTEKSYAATSGSKYTFEVSKDASKLEIKKAIELIFPDRKVTKICTVFIPSTEKRYGKKLGRKKSSKKAIVTLQGEPLTELIGV